MTYARRFTARPPTRSSVGARVDLDLLAHLQNTVEHWASGAEAAAQRAGQLLRDARITEACEYLPNIRIVARGRAHASRRITKRPWQADAFLRSVMDTRVMGNNSITVLIQHSYVFQGWLLGNARTIACSAWLRGSTS